MVPKVTFGRLLAHTRALRVVIAVVLAVRVLLFSSSATADPVEAKKIFTTRCMACHTFGKGVKVGPDLKGVTERRQRPWLLKFIRSSQTVIGSGDPIASGLFAQFKQQRMPDWSDLSEAQIGSILDWLAISGPDQQEPDERAAASATLTEIATGRALFHGGKPFARGGVACASCHSIRDQGGSQRGGTLASELTNAYAQFQDGALTQFMRHPCFARYPESTLAAFLAPEESFAIKAYLRETALYVQPQLDSQASTAMVAKSVDGDTGAAAATTGKPAAPAPSSTKRVAWAPGTVGKPPRAVHIPDELLFLVFPYAALLVFLIGLGVRHALARRQPEALRTGARDAWRIFRGNLAWRMGLGAIVVTHLAGLLFPAAVLAWNGVPLRLYLLEASGFLLGAVTLAGLVHVMWHHVGRGVATQGERVARLPEIADYALLSLGCVAVVSGLVSAVMYRWGSSWAIATVVPYMRSLAVGAPASELVEQMPFLVRLHVFSWFAMLALMPFTSLAMILVSAADRALLVVARPIGAVAGGGRRALAKLSPARWIWPDEDPVVESPKPHTAQEPS